MANFKEYLAESYDELKNKVTWPSWNELQSSAIIVLVATFIIAIVIYAMDLGFGQLMKLIYNNIFN